MTTPHEVLMSLHGAARLMCDLTNKLHRFDPDTDTLDQVEAFANDFNRISGTFQMVRGKYDSFNIFTKEQLREIQEDAQERAELRRLRRAENGHPDA